MRPLITCLKPIVSVTPWRLQPPTPPIVTAGSESEVCLVHRTSHLQYGGSVMSEKQRQEGTNTSSSKSFMEPELQGVAVITGILST
jgi:hypothetical protein